MKRLFLPAAVILLAAGNVTAKPVKHSHATSAFVSGSASAFSNAFAFVPTSKVAIDPKTIIDERNGDEDEGYDVYMAGKDFKGDVLYDEAGSVMGYYEQIKNTRMPLAVVSAIEAKFPGAEFTKDEEKIDYTNLRSDVYKAYFIYGKEHGYALVNANGKIIRSKK